MSSRSTEQARKRVYGWQDKVAFFDAVVAGASMGRALALIGASADCGTRWWRDSAGMMMTGGPGGAVLVDPPAADARWVGRGLTAVERGQIQAGVQAGHSQAQIARSIGRHRSVVSRELARNAGPDGSYYAALAHARAYHRGRRPKRFKLLVDPGLCRRIEGWMDQGWSPRLIAQVLAEDCAGDQTRRVSHETIYQALYVQTRGHLRADLHQQLSLKRRARVSRTQTRRGGRNASPFKQAYKISERPAEVADRAVPGHWEGDRATRCRTG